MGLQRNALISTAKNILRPLDEDDGTERISSSREAMDSSWLVCLGTFRIDATLREGTETARHKTVADSTLPSRLCSSYVPGQLLRR